MVAELLQSKGYTPQQIETARNRWPLPLSPTPSQFKDKFMALLNYNPSAYSNGYQTAAERRNEAVERELNAIISLREQISPSTSTGSYESVAEGRGQTFEVGFESLE